MLSKKSELDPLPLWIQKVHQLVSVNLHMSQVDEVCIFSRAVLILQYEGIWLDKTRKPFCWR